MRPRPNVQVFNCEHKLRWSDEHDARAAVSFLVANSKTGKLWVYKCRTCLGWHSTKKDHGRAWLVTEGKPYAD